MYYEKTKNNSLSMIIIILFLIVIIFILVNMFEKIENNSKPNTEEIELTGTNPIAEDFNLQDLLKNTSYSIVGVSKLNEKNTSLFVENSEEKLGLGTGIILSSNGFILSNYEITGGEGETCFVTLKNGNIYPAEVKWGDKSLDISIIKISAENLLEMKLGDSNILSIGDELFILSNPTGFESNEIISDILVSKVNSTFKIVHENETIYVEDIIKINSEIGYEKNGGAVINKNGEVLGIASSKNNSIIPINRIKNILEKLKQNEKYNQPYLGIHGFDNNVLKYLIPEYPLKIGIYVDNVEENSSASGQVFVGDVITKIDDYELSNYEELSEYLSLKLPRDRISLTIIRGGKKEIVVNLILKEEPRLP